MSGLAVCYGRPPAPPSDLPFLLREYLAIFKKTVAMHEVFLCRVAAHPVLRKDLNFHVFLEYNQDVSGGGAEGAGLNETPSDLQV